MIVGFTGTRRGMHVEQHRLLVDALRRMRPEAFHHGMCIGADSEAALIVRDELPDCRIIGHPPVITSMLNASACHDELLPALPYLDRNKAIVDACDWLLAAPDGPPRLRSGTWSTIRYAFAQKRPVRILMPRGTINEDLLK